MRELTDHVVKGDAANHQLKIEVHDEPGDGGACHAYVISRYNDLTNKSRDPHGGVLGKDRVEILFQNGPIPSVGVNGVTHEALLAILIDRMEGFQAGKFVCDDNALALSHLQLALDYLQQRTRNRLKRGVEGTHTV